LQAKDVAVSLFFEPIHGLVAGVVSITADGQLTLEPMTRHALDKVADDLRYDLSFWAFAGEEDTSNGLAGAAIDMDRLKAEAASMGVEEAELLVFMNSVRRIIDVQRHEFGRNHVDGTVKIDHLKAHASQGAPSGRLMGTFVLEPGEGWL